MKSLVQAAACVAMVGIAGSGCETGHVASTGNAPKSAAASAIASTASADPVAQAESLKAALLTPGAGERAMKGPKSGTVASLLSDKSRSTNPAPESLPASCKQGSGAVSSWPKELSGSPAAGIMIMGETVGLYSEELVLVPASTDPAPLRITAAANCPAVTMQVKGHAMKMQMMPLAPDELPTIAGADVTGRKLLMTVTDVGMGGGTVWVNVRKGPLVMAMGFIGVMSVPPADTVKNLVQTGWSRAQKLAG